MFGRPRNNIFVFLRGDYASVLICNSLLQTAYNIVKLSPFNISLDDSS